MSIDAESWRGIEHRLALLGSTPCPPSSRPDRSPSAWPRRSARAPPVLRLLARERGLREQGGTEFVPSPPPGSSHPGPAEQARPRSRARAPWLP
ncbi:hypothetical protein [Streptacidiphilus monticola]|uniref:Uncharacterized protein n=1 Tax=Streptacidiphilus monticola TaxID=2161674 RepID=A0ABW1FT15_9ACTN